MKILHTADIHVGYDTHGRLDTARGINSRWVDFERCFKFMVDFALAEDIDLFLFCGDAYRDALPSPTEQQIWARCLRPILDKKIPVVMLVGNHDMPVAFGKANSLQIFADLSDGIHLFAKPETKDIETKSGIVRIVGLPWPARSALYAKEEFADLTVEQLKNAIHERYVLFIESEAERIEEEKLTYPAILAAHLHIEGAVFTEGSEKLTIETKDPILPLAAMTKKQFSYTALGHIHKHQDLNELGVDSGEPPVVYCGSFERISFGEWNQKKGFVIIEIDEHKKASYKHIPTPARPFASIELDLRFSNDPMRKLRSEIESHEIQNAIVRVRLRCKTEQKKLINFAEIKTMLATAFVVTEISITTDEEKERRRVTEIERFDSTEKALEKYIEQREDLKPKKEKIILAARELEQQTDE
jgi:DNA repair protein SbcD/Mre11